VFKHLSGSLDFIYIQFPLANTSQILTVYNMSNTKAYLQALLAAIADTVSLLSSAGTSGGTCQEGDISHGAQYTREELPFEKLPEVCVAGSESILLIN
jgi:hypothetical protein